MNREIKFRGRRIDNNEWVYGSLIICSLRWGSGYLIHTYASDEQNKDEEIEVYHPTIGQYAGLKDKNDKEIYEGDIVRYNKPYRTTQTHEGDNIPNGSYTEPMEPGIKTIYCEVKFKDGTFYLDIEDDVNYNMTTPISWYNIQWDLEMIKDAISWTRQDADWFDDPEEGDLQYLISECAKVENAEQLIKYFSGLEVMGNIFDNPEL